MRKTVCRATIALALLMSTACASLAARSAAGATDGSVAEELRATERARLRALVAADTATARRLHAVDFQVVNPVGRALTREQYLGGVAAGTNDYLAWEADSIAVRLYGGGAALRYQSRVDLTVRGELWPNTRAWNTAIYERRDGRWQIVWFQVTDVP
jgi:hypothetical protein